MDDTLLIGQSSFLYFALIPFEASGVLRLFLICWWLYSLDCSTITSLSRPTSRCWYSPYSSRCVSPTWVSGAGGAAKFFLQQPPLGDVLMCGRRCVFTVNPRIMVEAFLKEFLGADEVLRMEIAAYRGWRQGFWLARTRQRRLRLRLGRRCRRLGSGIGLIGLFNPVDRLRNY